MNRREFTASLGALVGTAALPFTALRAVAAPTAVVPPATYAWASLIARARGTVSPDLLARQLKLSPQVADAVFKSLVRDGVVRAPTAAGIAQAFKPMQSTGHTATAPEALRKRMQTAWDRMQRMRDETDPLVKDDNPALGCEQTLDKEAADASPTQPVQESPRRG